MNASHAAALMTADQYRSEASAMLGRADAAAYNHDPGLASHLVACAQVYALLAISAQAAENATDLPF